LKKDTMVELPEEENVVRAMLARHLIEPVSDEPASKTQESDQSENKPKRTRSKS
jgi:hypothetical protein